MVRGKKGAQESGGAVIMLILVLAVAGIVLFFVWGFFQQGSDLIDGNDPSRMTGSLYTGSPIHIDTPTIIKAIAYDFSSLDDANITEITYKQAVISAGGTMRIAQVDGAGSDSPAMRGFIRWLTKQPGVPHFHLIKLQKGVWGATDGNLTVWLT